MLGQEVLKNQQLVNNLSAQLDGSLSKGINDSAQLKQVLANYKEAMKDYIELSSKKAEIVSKYANAKTGGSFNLPGVFNTAAGSYDLQQMKNDNAALKDISSTYASAQQQKDVYFKMIINLNTELQQYLRTVSKISEQLEIVFEQLQTDASWDLKK